MRVQMPPGSVSMKEKEGRNYVSREQIYDSMFANDYLQSADSVQKSPGLQSKSLVIQS